MHSTMRTLWVISEVAWRCCSTAAAMPLTLSPITPMVEPMRAMASTTPMVDCWMPWTSVAISSVEEAVWEASAFTSVATTAKPLPASPARAASMLALSASRLVCWAMAVMMATTSPIFWAESDRPLVRPSARRDSATASSATLRDWAICRPIPSMEAESCSLAEATAPTLLVAVPAASAAARVRCAVSDAIPATARAEPVTSSAATDREPATACTVRSNPSASVAIRARRSSSARRSWSRRVSSARWRASSASRNASTAPWMSAISRRGEGRRGTAPSPRVSAWSARLASRTGCMMKRYPSSMFRPPISPISTKAPSAISVSRSSTAVSAAAPS